MSLQSPPDDLVMTPKLEILPAGTMLWRCHDIKYDAEEFNTRLVHSHFGGNRFDGTPHDPYSYAYLAREPATALAEVLLRSRPFPAGSGPREIGFHEIASRVLAAVRTTADLVLVRLIDEEDLAAVCQDSWLVDTDARDYPQTRYWAAAIRRQATAAQGMVWVSRRHHPRRSLVLFGDRCGPKPLRVEPTRSVRLSSPAGLAEANRLLNPLRAVVNPPRRRLWPLR